MSEVTTEQPTSSPSLLMGDPVPSKAPDAPVQALQTTTTAPAPDLSDKPASTTKDWRDSLPQELKDSPSLKPITDIENLAKSFIHAQKLVGKDKIVVPDQHASKEDWQKVYQKLGLPESKDKYDFKVPEGTDKEFVGKFKDFAYDNGILPSQAEKLFDWYNGVATDINSKTQSQLEEQYSQAVDGLKKEWGAAYDRKLTAARQAFLANTDEETREFFESAGLSNDPKVVKVFAKIAEQLGEDKFVDGASQGKMGFTPEEAEGRINEIMGNKEHPFWHGKHPGHKSAVDEMQRLHNMSLGNRS